MLLRRLREETVSVRIKKEDALWAEAVKIRDDYTCQYPSCGTYYPKGNRQGLHAHHIFGRSRMTTRHMVANGISLCFGHHMWAHSQVLDFHDWIRGFIGADEYDELRRLSRETKATA
jgi:hypothetical protein